MTVPPIMGQPVKCGTGPFSPKASNRNGNVPVDSLGIVQNPGVLDLEGNSIPLVSMPMGHIKRRFYPAPTNRSRLVGRPRVDIAPASFPKTYPLKAFGLLWHRQE